MRLQKLWIWTAVIGSLTACSLWMAAPAMAAGADQGWQMAQYNPQQQGGMQQGGKQGGQQGGMQGQQGSMQGGQQGGMQGQPGGQGGGNNSCVQSYQRCVMMCAGNGSCVNNCNIGYAVCQQQGGGS